MLKFRFFIFLAITLVSQNLLADPYNNYQKKFDRTCTFSSANFIPLDKSADYRLCVGTTGQNFSYKYPNRLWQIVAVYKDGTLEELGDANENYYDPITDSDSYDYESYIIKTEFNVYKFLDQYLIIYTCLTDKYKNCLTDSERYEYAKRRF